MCEYIMCIKDIICCLKEAIEQDEPSHIEERQVRNNITTHTPYIERVIEIESRNGIIQDKPGTPRRRIIRRVEV